MLKVGLFTMITLNVAWVLKWVSTRRFDFVLLVIVGVSVFVRAQMLVYGLSVTLTVLLYVMNM